MLCISVACEVSQRIENLQFKRKQEKILKNPILKDLIIGKYALILSSNIFFALMDRIDYIKNEI